MKFFNLLKFFIFVAAIVSVFSIYQRFHLSGSTEMASSTVGADNSLSSFLGIISRVNDQVKKMSPSYVDDFKCSCQFGDEQNILKFELREQCQDPGRMDIQNQIDRFSSLPSFAKYLNFDQENVHAKNIPRKCVLYIIRAMESNPAVKTFSYGICQDQTGYPQRGVGKPCMTEQYVNLAYNSFVDVANCLGLDQKHLVPKIMNESGFVFNSWAHLRVRETLYDKNKQVVKTSVLDPTEKQEDVFDIVQKADDLNAERQAQDLPIERQLGIFGGDAGIGQLTGAALNDANEYLPALLREVKNKGKNGDFACQRIADIVNDTEMTDALDTKLENRCEVVTLPQNPIRSLLIMGILNRNNRRYIQDKWNAEGIDDLMSKAKIASFDKSEIKDALTLLAYNSGSATSVILFKNWLKMRLENIDKYPIKLSDLSFNEKSRVKYKDKALISMLPQEANALRGQLSDLDHLDFGTFMMVYREQNRWARGYLYSVREMVQVLEQKMGKGVCTDSSFLGQ